LNTLLLRRFKPSGSGAGPAGSAGARATGSMEGGAHLAGQPAP
jgi:hypothetical protein